MKARYLIIAAVILAVLSIVALRANSLRAAELRSQVLASDSQGQSVTQQLGELRKFVFSHMNASTKFELSASYERAVEQARAASQANASGDVYTQAQAACGQEVGTNSVAQVQCVQNYLEQNLQSANNPEPLELPDRSLYSYTYLSPSWTADLAGLALLSALVMALGALIIYVRQSFKSA